MFGKKKKIVTNTEPGQWREIWRLFCKNKVSVAALIFLIIIIFFALFANVIVDYQTVITPNPQERLLGPSLEHLFGTDHMGRDLFVPVQTR